SRLFLLLLAATLTASFFPACGARGDITEVGGGGSGTCALLGAPCADAGTPCCGELLCSAAGTCKPSAICLPGGDACTLTTDCCALDCVNGFCGGTLCTPQGSPCGPTDACCGGIGCVNGLCGGTACQPEGALCATGADCCNLQCGPTGFCQGSVCKPQG